MKARVLILAFFSIYLGQAVASEDEDPTDIILMFGDSITSTRPHLPADSPPSARRGRPNGLNAGPTVETLEELLNNSGKSVKVLNYGFSGSTTQQGVDRISADISSAKSNYPGARFYIAILYGTNDPTLGIFTPEQTKQNILEMIDISRENDVLPVLGNLLPRLDGVNVAPYNEVIAAAALDREVMLVDFFSIWLNNLPLLEPDGLHPTFAGYKFMGAIWFDNVFLNLIPDARTTTLITPVILDLLLSEDPFQSTADAD